MSMLINTSRFLMFGSEAMSKKKVTFTSALWGSTENQIRGLVGLPPISRQRHTLSSWTKQGLQRSVLNALGLDQGQRLPKGWPSDVFDTLDRYVRAKGGSMRLGDVEIPLLKLQRHTAVALSSMWVCYVDFETESANWKAVQSAEEALEDAIARECNKQLNLRILSKPARIEIDKPDVPMFTLKSRWDVYTDGRVNPGRFLVGIQSTVDGDLRLHNRLEDSNEYSCAFLGASGSGKTQAITSALLTVCAVTSPADLSVIVIDPKGLDLPVEGLPHLTIDPITDPDLASNIVLTLADEMKRRAKAKNRAASRKRILLVMDELAFLIQQDGSTGEKLGPIGTALMEITEMGRAWGIHIMAGSQRATNSHFPKRILSQFPALWIGAVNDATEAAFAGGAGCDAHKLPGKGSAMYYERGSAPVRIQSTYIGNANKDDYGQIVGWFVERIQTRWVGIENHWTPGASAVNVAVALPAGAQQMVHPTVVSSPSLEEPADVETVAVEDDAGDDAATNDGAVDTAILDDLDPHFMDMLRNAYDDGRERFNQRRVREVYEIYTDGKRMNTNRERAIFQAFMATFAA